jgi:hypothetical protein
MSPGARTVSGKRRSDFHDPIRLVGVLQFTQILRSSGSVDQDWRSRHLVQRCMQKSVRLVVGTAALAAGLGLAGLATAIEVEAQPGPFPTWCPGDFWDPGWGNNWDGGGCHDNWRGAGPNPHPDAHWGP